MNPRDRKTVVVACLPLLFVLLLPLLNLAQAPGARPKEALDPRTYAQISGKPIAEVMIDQHNKLIDKVERLEVQEAATRQAVDDLRVDLSHRLDLHRTEIDALQPEVEAADIARLKQDMQAIKDEKAAREAERKADREAMMGWFRGIGSGVLVAVLLLGLNALLAYWRERRRGREMKVLNDHTNGMTTQIARLSEAKGHADEREGLTG
jgi:DNA repair exonuclease SbcCD ATPase subunit